MNMATGGFGTEVTVKTDPKLKQQLGGAAYIITGRSTLFTLLTHGPAPCKRFSMFATSPHVVHTMYHCVCYVTLSEHLFVLYLL